MGNIQSLQKDTHFISVSEEEVVLESMEKKMISASTEEYSQEQIFGKYLRSKRNAKGLSLRTLASKAKISYSALNKAENGHELPSANTLRKLAPYLGIPIDELLLNAGYHFKYPKDGPIYLNLTGEILDLEKTSSSMYNRDPELFLQITDWYKQYTKEDAETLSILLSILKAKKRMYSEEPNNNPGSREATFLKLWESLKHLIQTCNFFLSSLLSVQDN